MDREENERLTRVGPGTPMGALLRRYWWPIWFSEQVRDQPVPVRLLAEDFILFRQPDGRLGLLERHCAHRRASLEFGRVEADGIRCCYHGWKYDCAGQCIDTPLEPEESTLKQGVKMKAYAAEEAGGLVFGYVGPQPAPIFPRYDLLFREAGLTVVGADEDHCNWLQRAENTVDQMHLAMLHASVYPDLAFKRLVTDYDPTWYGARIIVNVPERKPKIDHFIFPSTNRYTQARKGEVPAQKLRMRVPTDDTKTTTFYANTYPSITDRGRLETKGLERSERGKYERVEDGWWRLASHDQDRAAQEGQGLIADRSTEYLATSDKGLVFYRRLLRDAVRAVEAGRDPIGVRRGAGHDAVIDFDSSMEELESLNA